jgi:hypothetical protein
MLFKDVLLFWQFANPCFMRPSVVSTGLIVSAT